MPDFYSWIAWALAVLAFMLGAQVFGVVGAIVLVAAIIVGLTVLGFTAGERRRREQGRIEPRFRPTDEIFNDPAGGGPMRVYLDPATGERRYRPEPR